MKKFFQFKKNVLVAALVFGVLFSGSFLFAAADDKSGQEIGADEMYSEQFWQTLWGSGAVETDSTATVGTPWIQYEKVLPYQRKGQRMYRDDFDFVLGDSSVTLTKDIDYGGRNFPSISNYSHTFDGGGHTIKNFRISGKAMFENLTGMVKNLVIENAKVVYDGDTVGILAAEIDGGTIQNCLIKDCHLTGKRYLGMFAGNMKNTATIEKCLVVNGTITSKHTVAYSTAYNESYVGGVAGYVGLGCSLTNCVSMLDMFKLHHAPNKGGKLGRVWGYNTGSVSYNYGWVETGFTLWNDDINDFYWVYYPYWSSSSVYTGNLTTSAKHGLNLYTGDYNDAALAVGDKRSVNQDFWTSDVSFSTSDWEFPSGFKYPVPTNSGVDAKELIHRRGFEADMSDYVYNTTSDIYTALMFSKVKDKSACDLNLYTDISLYNDAKQFVWSSTTTYGSGGVFAQLAAAKTFDGKGHEVQGVRISGVNGGRVGFFPLAYADSKVTRLALTNIYISSSNAYSIYVGGMIGAIGGNDVEISDCYLDVQSILSKDTYSSTGSFACAGGLVGDAGNKPGVYTKNILKIGSVKAQSTNNYNGAYVASISAGGNTNAEIVKNVILRRGTSNITLTAQQAYGSSNNAYNVAKGVVSNQNYYRSASYFTLVGGDYNEGNQGIVEPNMDEDFWTSTIELDPNIWHIPTEADKEPLLKKESFDWVTANPY